MQTRDLFNEVIQAAKNKNTEALTEILGNKKHNQICKKINDVDMNPVSQLAFEGDHEAVKFLLDVLGDNKHAKWTAAAGFAMGNHKAIVSEMLSSETALLDAVCYGFALGGHNETINSLLKVYETILATNTKLRNSCFYCVSKGYAVVGRRAEYRTENQSITIETQKFINFGAIAGLIYSQRFVHANDLIVTTGYFSCGVAAYIQHKNHAQINKLLEQGCPQNIVIEEYKRAGFHKEADAILVKRQFEKQQSQRNIWAGIVAVLAIVLTPLSLLISLPLYFRARNNQPIQALVTTSEDEARVKKARNLYKQMIGTSMPTEKVEKIKKVLISDASETSKVYLVDKAKLDRFERRAGKKRDFIGATNSELEAARLKASWQASAEIRNSLYNDPTFFIRPVKDQTVDADKKPANVNQPR